MKINPFAAPAPEASKQGGQKEFLDGHMASVEPETTRRGVRCEGRDDEGVEGRGMGRGYPLHTLSPAD